MRLLGSVFPADTAACLAFFVILTACGESDPGAPSDGGPADGAIDDAGSLDAGMDAGGDAALPPTDAAMDSTTADVDAPDAEDDAGADADIVVPPNTAPMHLSETGLYAEGSVSELAEGVMAYAPRYELWSDGADKQRWLLLPEGETIDTSDIDAFVFPVGTKAWKEFSHDGVKLETRLLWKTSTGWVLIAYAWNEAQDDAVAVPRGADDVLGTDHDIPQRINCRECHDGAADTLLGVGAIQLAHSGSGLTLAQLESDGRLSDAPPADIERPDTLEWNALGYLHTNCGTCHNPIGGGFDRVDMELWLRVQDLDDVASTRTYATAVDIDIEQSAGDDTARIEPGSSGDSQLITRMKLRDAEEAMPPIASEFIDDAGIGLVEDWIDSLAVTP
jgi:hypothetical protein